MFNIKFFCNVLHQTGVAIVFWNVQHQIFMEVIKTSNCIQRLYLQCWLDQNSCIHQPSQRFCVFFCFFSGKESNDILFVSLIIFIIDVTNKDSLANIKQSTDYLPIEYFMGRLLFIGMLNHNVYCTVLVFTVNFLWKMHRNFKSPIL